MKDGTIVQPLTSHIWKHRDVKAKRDFAFPPPVPDPATMDGSALSAILWASDSDLVRTLATKLNIGGKYSEELCARTGIAPAIKAAEVGEAQAEALHHIYLFCLPHPFSNHIRFLRPDIVLSNWR